jgi:hypothetical protein
VGRRRWVRHVISVLCVHLRLFLKSENGLATANKKCQSWIRAKVLVGVGVGAPKTMVVAVYLPKTPASCRGCSRRTCSA